MRYRIAAIIALLAVVPAFASLCTSLQKVLANENATVVCPGDAAYPQARIDYNQGLRPNLMPGAVVFVGSPQAVLATMRYINGPHGPLCNVTVRGGRHDYELLSVAEPDGIVIDVSPMNSTAVDAAADTVTVGAGARLIDAYAATYAAGYFFVGGTCPTVGVSGVSLGGGYGFLSRAFGMACDQIVSVEIVTSNYDEIITANATHHSDLFWALRGGGNGNFGVVTSFTYALHPLGDTPISWNTASWRYSASDNLTAMIDTWQRWAWGLPANFTPKLIIYQNSIGLANVLLGPLADMQSYMAQLTAAMTSAPAAMNTTLMPNFMALVLELGGCHKGLAACIVPSQPVVGSQSGWKGSSVYAMDFLAPAAMATIQQFMGPQYRNCCQGDGSFAGIMIDTYGGAINETATTATAFVHRKAYFCMQILAGYNETGLKRDVSTAWVQAFAGALRPLVSPYAYRNYADLDLGPDYMTAYYGENADQLVNVKGVYDPTNLFNSPQSVPATGW